MLKLKKKKNRTEKDPKETEYELNYVLNQRK